MRCRVAGLGLLATPARLPHGVINSAARWPQPLQTSPSSARLELHSCLNPGGNSRGGKRSPVAPFHDGTERSTGSQRPRRGLGGFNRTAARSGAVRPRSCSPASTQDDPRAHLKHSPTATILELQCRTEDKSVLAVYGKLHRLLGDTFSRQLLGPDAVATLTSLDFLVLHHRDGGPSLFDGSEANDGDGIGGGARLAVGDRSWDICGIGPWGSTPKSVVRAEGEEPVPLVLDQGLLEREIESVVKIASRSEVFTLEPAPAVRPTPRGHRSGASIRSTAEKAQRHLKRLRARSRARRELEQTRPSRASSSAPLEPAFENPLLGVGLGALLSPRNCNAVLREAQKVDRWASWHGDFLGVGAVATSLEDLPSSRAIWDGKPGERVRARIAAVYGVPPADIAVDASGVFVCRVGANDSGERGSTPEQGAEGFGLAGGRERTFRRSKSLVAFCVALSAEEGPLSSLAVCLEQRGECIRLGGQGSGVIFSGKMRHGSVRTPARTGSNGDEDSSRRQQRENPPPIFLLKGFASIRHPSVLEESAHWQWGSPAWHVDAPWIKDRDILDRIWVAGGAAATGAVAAGKPGVAEALGGRYHHLERMNTTTVHRYYRQGMEGMDVPVVDPSGRPVIDLIEDAGPSRMVAWLPGIAPGKPGEITLKAVLRRRFPWGRRRQVGKAGLSTEAGVSPLMDAALQELFGASSSPSANTTAGAAGAAAAGETFAGVWVPPIKYVFVDPRYRGLGLGRRLFLEAMRTLAGRGFRFALIVVEDNGSGGLFGFYEGMGFVRAEELLGLPRAMIAPIPPPDQA
ncbi:unnamed protein product [Scytosiphon promiscuus]